MSDSEEPSIEIFTSEESVEQEPEWAVPDAVLNLEDIEGCEDEIDLIESEDDSGSVDLEACASLDEALLAEAEGSDVDPDFDIEEQEDEEAQAAVESEEEALELELCQTHEDCILYGKECHNLLLIRKLVPVSSKKECVAALAEAICDSYCE
jgi:hypothetical protein